MKITKKSIIGGALLTTALFAAGGAPAMADDSTTGPSGGAEVIVDAPMAPAPNFGFQTGFLAPIYGPALAFGSNWAVYSPILSPIVGGIGWDSSIVLGPVVSDPSVDDSYVDPPFSEYVEPPAQP